MSGYEQLRRITRLSNRLEEAKRAKRSSEMSRVIELKSEQYKVNASGHTVVVNAEGQVISSSHHTTKEADMSCFKCGQKATHITFWKRMSIAQKNKCRKMDPTQKGWFLVCRECWDKAEMKQKAELVFTRISK